MSTSLASPREGRQFFTEISQSAPTEAEQEPAEHPGCAELPPCCFVPWEHTLAWPTPHLLSVLDLVPQS
ncbi:g3873 [Coccomyxa elongata]